jgi:hypothetical protein
MTAISDAQPITVGYLGRRIGRFAIGAFAGLCAAFVPRLAFIVGPGTSTTALTMDAFDGRYVLAALGFAILIGGVAMILEWESDRSPRDTFMAALGIPAILTGMFNTASASRDAIMFGERLKVINDSRARDEQIPVVEGAEAVTPTSGWLHEWPLMPTVYAEERAATQKAQAKVGVVYREPRYWVVLDVASTREDADRRVAQLGQRYGALTVQRVDDSYFVCPSGGTLTYSEAVSKAIDLKRQSQGTLTPKLVRSS